MVAEHILQKSQLLKYYKLFVRKKVVIFEVFYHFFFNFTQ